MILASPPDLAMWLSLLTAIAYAIPALVAERMGPSLAKRYLWLAWLLHGFTIGLGLMGETPRFGFAPALSVTVWWVLTAYAVETQYFPQFRARWAMAILGSAAVAMSWVFPGQALQVSASFWLPLHWALGIASYGMFAAAVIHAALMTSAEIEIRQGNENQSGLPLLTLERLMFRFVSHTHRWLCFWRAAVWRCGRPLEMGSQNGVFYFVLAYFWRLVGRSPPVWLARTSGRAGPLHRLCIFTLGLRRFTFRS